MFPVPEGTKQTTFRCFRTSVRGWHNFQTDHLGLDGVAQFGKYTLI